MSELLRVLKNIKINTQQSAPDEYTNEAIIKLTFPRRRLNINVTRDVQDSGDERYPAQT